MLQRTPEWERARYGKITATDFRDALAKESTKAYQRLVRRLADDLLGFPRDEAALPNKAMLHGIENEPRARWILELWLNRNGTEESYRSIVDCAFSVSESLPYVGCSPDGLIGEDAGCELKCRVSWREHAKSVKHAKENKPCPEHVAQVQGSLWVTGRQKWYYLSHFIHRAGKARTETFSVATVERDEKMIAKIEAACKKVWEAANQLAEKSSERSIGLSEQGDGQEGRQVP
jgi:hypothetical protein